MRAEARIEEQELERAAQADEPREEERRAFRAGQTGLRIRPLERRAFAGDDEVAADGEAEAARGGDSVDGGDERLRCAADLGDGAVEVFEDLFEDRAVAVELLRC